VREQPIRAVIEGFELKAIRIHEHGPSDTLLYEQAPMPCLSSPTDVVVKLTCASLNHIDIWTRIGTTGIAISMPHILGADGAGSVAEIGTAVDTVKVGDPVCLYPFTGCGRCEFCLDGRDFMCIRIRSLGERMDGTYAQYVKVPALNCFPIPHGFTFEEAAAFPLVFITLWRMLITNARLKPGESLLIIGIGGGVASAALQLATKIGARVIVTSGSDEKLTRAKKLGAQYGINHKARTFAAKVMELTGNNGADVVLDSVGGEIWRESLAALAPGGRLVTCGATAGGDAVDDLRAICSKHLKIYGSTLGSRQEFRQLLKFVELTELKPVVDKVFQLGEAASAHRYLEAGKQFGKVVLRIPA
jgi:NADPH:quinone reductase-like Zn-dependent oxidoreductase